MRLVVVTQILTLLSAGAMAGSVAAPCTPVRGSCAFYTDCLEANYHCGEEGYPLGYGNKYCNKFSDEQEKLSAEGKDWMLDTMVCLQTALVPYATGNTSTTCDELEHAAFATHPACYVDSGFCELPPTDWVAVVDIVGLKTLFESWDAFLASLEAAEGCLEAWTYLSTI
ncbi:hypothetical protein CYLTODRAFT_484685 [Cylindrobasidium torrendii FP15055 ss-10]|uniref:Uncharacterized protein n=1 Tax=Cylindrobasidium torrendii FP15055 ss-10 TaxID=1314674 RepID=A0A0D7BW12_9AGAR|nr:hypothetical protein CYLTODRAFT_484685 [Cylindrobasidium torrendii FP15055 ss-10]